MAALQKSNAVKYPSLSPWKILAAQVAVTALSMTIWSFFGEPVGVSLYTQAAFLGGLISVLPSALFLLRLELAKKSQLLNPGHYLAALVSGEFIKIALGPPVGDLCTCLKVCLAGVVVALRVINEIEPRD